MKYDLSVKIVDIKGQPIKDSKIELTVKDICVQSLLANFESEKIDGVEKYKRFKLSQRLENNKNKVIGLNVEEVSLIKKLLGMAYTTLIVGQVYDILEGNTKEEDGYLPEEAGNEEINNTSKQGDSGTNKTEEQVN